MDGQMGGWVDEEMAEVFLSICDAEFWLYHLLAV